MELWQMTAHQLHHSVENREVSALEVAETFLSRIKTTDSDLNSFLSVMEERAIKQAQRVDDCLAMGEKLPLAGVPVALKDNLSTAGIRTTCASKFLASYTPPFDATVVTRLLAAGAIPIGKTNMDEFAMGSSTEYSSHGATRNPWQLDHVPGGSSGGSAVAVAVGQVPVSLGSDTGGSVRQPAALCGVVGLKPTYGRVSRYGLIAFSSSMDQVGPIARDILDCALMMNVIAGYDDKDSTSSAMDIGDFTRSLGQEVSGLRIGLPRELFSVAMDIGVKEHVIKAVDMLGHLGAVVEECSIPSLPAALDIYRILSSAEAYSNLARYDGVRFGYRAPTDSMENFYDQTRFVGFGQEVKRRITFGALVLSRGSYPGLFDQAVHLRSQITDEMGRVFRRFDVLASPTVPTTAWPLGSKTCDPLAMMPSDRFTVPANLAGNPALTIPCGFVQGLPVGLQLLGRQFGEETLFRLAYAYEQAAGQPNVLCRWQS